MKNMRKIKMAVVVLVLLCVNFVMFCEASALTKKIYITVKVNGNCIKMDTLPYVKNDRIFVPVRFAAEALGAEVKWVGEEKKVIIMDAEKTIEMFQGSNELIINGESKPMDTVVEVLNGRTMVPVRHISEKLGCSVEWDKSTYSVLISKEGAAVPAAYINDRGYSDDDIIWLSKIVSVEGRGLSIDAKVAIANVVLNRKKSPQFPNSVYDVIFDKVGCVQFPPAHKEGFRDIVPPDECVIAAKMALEGNNNIDKCLFFNNAPFKGKEDDLYKRIDGEYFYY